MKNKVLPIPSIACALLFVLVAAASAGAVETKVMRDIPYCPDEVLASASDYRKERCRLDVRVPVGVTGFPTVVWFHGGGLTGGEKHFIRIDEGIAQVAANYRLLQKDGSVTGDDCIDDAAAAVAWTLKNVASLGGDPQYLPKVDRLAPLAFCSKDLPPIVSICGEPPWEWACRAEENRLLIASCVALGHEKARFVSCPYADHGRALTAGVPYVEMFVQGRLPDRLRVRRATPSAAITATRPLPPSRRRSCASPSRTRGR